MKWKFFSFLILLLGFCAFVFGQHHHDHGFPEKPKAKDQATPGRSSKLGDLLSEGESALQGIRESVGIKESLDRAVVSYVAVMDEIDGAIRTGKPDDGAFKQNLVKTEKILRGHIEVLQGLIQRAPADLKVLLEEASGATVRALDLASARRTKVEDNRTSPQTRDESANENRASQNDHDHD